jgi:hypothetical protein
MFDQKPEPGKGTRTNGHAGRAAEPQVGKQSRVEQELGGQGHGGPVAKAADDPTAGGTISSDYASFKEGDVFVSESVAATLSHGKGPVHIYVNKGGLTVGNEKLDVDFKSANAATGKHLQVSGASVELIKGHTSHTSAKMEDGYLGVEYSTSWTIESKGHHPWSVTLSFSTFVGAKPPHAHHHWWQDIPGATAVAGALAGALKLLKGVIGDIIKSAPEWGPVVEDGLELAAA